MKRNLRRAVASPRFGVGRDFDCCPVDLVEGALVRIGHALIEPWPSGSYREVASGRSATHKLICKRWSFREGCT